MSEPRTGAGRAFGWMLGISCPHEKEQTEVSRHMLVENTDFLQFFSPIQDTIFCPLPRGHLEDTLKASGTGCKAEAYGLLGQAAVKEGNEGKIITE